MRPVTSPPVHLMVSLMTHAAGVVAAATADKLIHLAKDKLGGVSAPESVDFAAALPRSPVGKKKTLREPYWAGRDRKI